MLVLSRNKSERIIIETPCGNISVMLVDIKSFVAARIGIEAPQNFNIYREELRDDVTLDCRSLGQVSPNAVVDRIRENLEQAAKQHHDHTPND